MIKVRKTAIIVNIPLERLVNNKCGTKSKKMFFSSCRSCNESHFSKCTFSLTLKKDTSVQEVETNKE